MPITQQQMTIAGFEEVFQEIVASKEKAGIEALQVNPDDLLERAKSYGVQYKNGSWGWNSNIWSRSAAGSVVVNDESEMTDAHRFLMLKTIEFMMCRPLIQVDANLGMPGSKAEMRCRLFCDPQFPDLAYRWKELNFPGSAEGEADARLYIIPHYLDNPKVPGSEEMLRVMRFPNAGYSIITCSSYQGEIKKGFLSHWITHVYNRGGTGEHASLKEFTVTREDGSKKRIVMSTWGLSGSGKSTHGMYVVNDHVAPIYQEKFGIDPREFISDQAIKNDDIVGVFSDQVVSPESGSWTKTEDVGDSQIAIYRAAMMPRALHENTEWDENGELCFEGKYFQYRGKLNQNARTVLKLEDTGSFDGSVDSSEALNVAIFISPGYLCDYAWLKLNDPTFAAKVLADGRTTGHPAQSHKGVGKEKYETRYCRPFTMGVPSAAHVHRFHEFLQARFGTDNPIETYQISTTGRVGAEYRWEVIDVLGHSLEAPQTVFETANGKPKPVGGASPSIEETELFLFQAARGAVEYEPHPVWGEKVLVPVKVPGLSAERLGELSPTSSRDVEELRRMLRAQVDTSKMYLTEQCPGLDRKILHAMDF